MTPLDLAWLCQKIYLPKEGDFDKIYDHDDVIIGHKQVGDLAVLAFRGSDNVGDWIHDAEAFPYWHPELGFVHAGFVRHMEDVLAEIRPLSTGPVVVTGHSLGGARARILAALLALDGHAVEQLCVFGSPKPGFANLRRILEKSKTPMQSYRHKNDPVPLVPGILPWWCHTDQWIALDSPTEPDNMDALRDHFIAGYITGLTA